MEIFEFIDMMVQEGRINAGDPSLAFLKENYFRVDDKTGTLYYTIDFNDIRKYNFANFINRRHYDLFSAGRFFETGMTYYEDGKKNIKPYILAFYTKEDECDDEEVRKIEFVDRINKVKTMNEVQLVFSVSLIEDKLYIDDTGIMYNNQIITFDKINVICQFYDMRHETEVSRQVFYDEGKVTFSTITMKRIATKNGLITKHINSRIVMNLKTGRTYKLNDFDLVAKRKVDKKKHPFLSLTAWNLNWLSYGAVRLSDEDFIKIGKAIEETVNDKDIIPFDKYIKDLDGGRVDRLQLLAGYNTNPFVPYSVLINMYLVKEDRTRELNNHNKVFNKNFNCKVLRNKNVKNELMAFLTTQGYSKKFANLKLNRYRATSILDDKHVYDDILELESIEDKNNKWKIIEGYFQNDDSIYDIKHFYTSEVYQELKKTHKEKDIVNAAVKVSDMRYLNDLANSFSRITRQIPDYQIPKRLRLMEIHDIVCGDAKKLSDSVYEYQYTEELENRFNRTVEGFDFSLATDSLQLVEVGTEMGICVGSYGKRVADKSCIIVTMRKDNKYVGCIEICSDGRANQVKAIRNNSLEGMALQAFRIYTELAKINTRDCHDLPLDSRIICDFEKVDIENETTMKIRVPKIINGKIDFEVRDYVKDTRNDCWF